MFSEFPECRDYPQLTSEIPEYFQPKCLDDGRFSPLQCNPHTGYCFCVSSQGATVPGTHIHVTEGVPVCQKYKGKCISCRYVVHYTIYRVLLVLIMLEVNLLPQPTSIYGV